MVLGEVGNVRRFPSRHHFATYTGTAPREYSSGGIDKHRLSRAGNRKLNHALHIIALSNKRYDQRGGEYYARKLAAGKGKKGALRCLKRRLSDVVFRTLVDDRNVRQAAGPEGQSGASTTSCAADRTPDDQHFGEATHRTRQRGPQQHFQPPFDTEGSRYSFRLRCHSGNQPTAYPAATEAKPPGRRRWRGRGSKA